MNPIKTLATGVMVLVGLWAFPARADLAMTLLTETYHVRGFVQREGYGPYPGAAEYEPGDSRSYDLTASSPPASGAVSVPRRLDGQETIFVRSLATRSHEDSTASFHVEAYGTWLGDSTIHPFPGGSYDDDPEYGPAVADAVNARLDVQFRLSGSADQLFLAVDGSGSGGTGRLTGGGRSWLLYQGPWGGVESPRWDPTEPIPIDRTQVYTLSMDVWPWWTKGGDGFRTVTFSDISNVSVVPLPGAALLGLLGLGCAGWRLRRGAA